MGNSKAGTSISHFIIDVSNEQAVLDSLMNIMFQDNDLTENEDYYREDTLSLGFESESDRILKEYIKESGIPKTTTEYEKAFNKISESISRQDYFGECSAEFIEIGDNKLSVVWVTGGE